MADEESKRVAAEFVKAVDGAKHKSLKDMEEGSFSAASVGALLKLIQLQKELRVEGPQKMSVQWVETWESNLLNDE